MRLRYLHLPRCGPLSDASVVFGREDLIAETLGLPRKGALNFVVGVNGSGKSSLLRALYRSFRALNHREWPTLPITLAWDRRIGDDNRTTVLRYTNEKDADSFFATLARVPSSTRRHQWESLLDALRRDAAHPLLENLEIAKGVDAITDSRLYARRPKHLIAYTSGMDDPWTQLERPTFQPYDEVADSYQSEDERPHGWTIDQEESEKLAGLFTSFERDQGATAGSPTLGGSPIGGLPLGDSGGFARKRIERLQQELEPLAALRQKVRTNHRPATERSDDSYFRIQTRDLRFAGITLALWQASREMAGRTNHADREALRLQLIEQGRTDSPLPDARRVLNEIDWFYPTHLSITYSEAADHASVAQRQELLCLVALADEVIVQPGGRQRAVLSLGPSENIKLSTRLENAFPLGAPDSVVERIAGRVDDSKTMAEAVLRVFSTDDNIDSTPMDVFNRLRDWERNGLLEDITLTMKRLHRPVATDGEPDDAIVTYDQLSDGEQMLLGRMGLLFLLRGQDGSLLLLDEPETHFNDVWKREIVEMIDMGLLNSTEANVVVATHTSIALTDAFAAEVTVLSKLDGTASAETVALPLFGADPGRVLLHVFGAPDMIGVRAAKLLRAKLAQVSWSAEDHEALRALIDETGSGWPRAKLMDILEQLDSSDAPPGT